MNIPNPYHIYQPQVLYQHMQNGEVDPTPYQEPFRATSEMLGVGYDLGDLPLDLVALFANDRQLVAAEYYTFAGAKFLKSLSPIKAHNSYSTDGPIQNLIWNLDQLLTRARALGRQGKFDTLNDIAFPVLRTALDGIYPDGNPACTGDYLLHEVCARTELYFANVVEKITQHLTVPVDQYGATLGSRVRVMLDDKGNPVILQKSVDIDSLSNHKEDDFGDDTAVVLEGFDPANVPTIMRGLTPGTVLSIKNVALDTADPVVRLSDLGLAGSEVTVHRQFKDKMFQTVFGYPDVNRADLTNDLTQAARTFLNVFA